MRGLRFVFSILLMALAAFAARADGMLIAPSGILRHFSEQTQTAVIDVRSDKTAQVNLFISLMDTSGKSNEVYHFLPLQTLPKKFEVKEELSDTKITEQFYRMYDAAWSEQRQVKQDLSMACLFGALYSGPGALIIFSPLLPQWHDLAKLSGRYMGAADTSEMKMAGIAAPQPAISVQTTHSRTDVYKALKPEEIGALTKIANLPEKVNQTLRQYAGRPFALLHLQTLPRKAKPSKESAPEGIANSEPQPGLMLTFAQEMQEKNGEYVYDYPLGTGQGWAKPIPSTLIIVTAEEKLPLAVKFPDREYPDSPALEYSGLGHSDLAVALAVNGRQLHFAQYHNSNKKRDVTIALRQTGGNKIIAMHKWVPYKLTFIWIAFPLLALALWLGSFRLIMSEDAYTRENGFFNCLLIAWLCSFLSLLILLQLEGLVFINFSTILLARFYASDYSWIAPTALLALLSAVVILLIHKRSRLQHVPPRIIWKSIATGITSGLFFTAISLILNFAFANWIGV